MRGSERCRGPGSRVLELLIFCVQRGFPTLSSEAGAIFSFVLHDQSCEVGDLGTWLWFRFWVWDLACGDISFRVWGHGLRVWAWGRWLMGS